MSRSSDLASSLATVAIAALGGPLFAVRAALAEVVRHAQSSYDGNEQTRQVQTYVRNAVSAWAQSEHFSTADLEIGLTLATEIVARIGLSTERLAELGFDANRAAGEVIELAKIEDPYWGKETTTALPFGLSVSPMKH